jgi:serine/threonine protein kinase
MINDPSPPGSGKDAEDDLHTASTISSVDDGGSAGDAAESSLRAANHIGPYRIVRKLGEGGMGTVFEAEQTEPVARRVALKLIKLGLDTEEVIARFNSERQALALMDHPNIARVLDAGSTPEGRPYFVMEYVKGIAVTNYCDSQRLDVRARLELFIKICEGVQHAHQKGIIHRDLKPSNVLVTLRDDELEPKIIDFGVAKATGRRLTDTPTHTGFGQVIGTPAYMSPEQAEMSALDIDTRADVYSLGVILYELLVGTLPFAPEQMRGLDFDEVRRRIREDAPPIPSTRTTTLGARGAEVAVSRRAANPAMLKRQLRGDLDWIVMKALEKDRTRRYPSASELASDIRRHLEDRPVQAGPPGGIYRLRKFVDRHRAAVVAVAAALLVLVGFTVTVTLQSIRLARERDRVQAARQIAEENLRLARDAVDETLTELGSEELTDVPQMAPVRRRILEKARRFYLELQDREPADPDLRLEPALARRRLGDIYRLESNIDAADAEYRAAIAMLAELVDAHPENPEYRDALAHSHNMRGELLRSHEQHRAVAAEAYARALAVQQELVSRLDGARLPDGRDPRIALARIHNNRGILLHDGGDTDAAEASYRAAVDVLAGVAASAELSGAAQLLELSRVHNNLGALYDETGRPEPARAAFERAITHLETLAAIDPDSRMYRLELSKTSNNLAFLLLNSGGDGNRALAVNDKALGSLTDLARPVPEVSGEHGHALWVRGLILRSEGAGDEAGRVDRDLPRSDGRAQRLRRRERLSPAIRLGPVDRCAGSGECARPARCRTARGGVRRLRVARHRIERRRGRDDPRTARLRGRGRRVVGVRPARRGG